MRRLPDGLAVWSKHLVELAPDLAPVLLPWLRRVGAAVGAMGGSRADAHGEPDGYAGLAARGPYHRLLPSQWLLADAYPDEFLRRAVMGEHAFFRQPACGCA